MSYIVLGFPGGASGKESTWQRDAGSILVSARCPGGGNGNLLQNSCLEKPHGQGSLAGYSTRGPQSAGHTELTEHTHTRFQIKRWKGNSLTVQAKWLSGEALQIAEKRREAKGKGEKERYTHLNAEFQRTAEKAFRSDQCKEIEENTRMGKTRDLFKKIKRYHGNISCKMGTIKDRNSMDLTEAEHIKKRWQGYTELYKKRSS